MAAERHQMMTLLLMRFGIITHRSLVVSRVGDSSGVVKWATQCLNQDQALNGGRRRRTLPPTFS